jgi:hypothetical protein
VSESEGADWEMLSSMSLITARQMIFICVVIEVIVQTFALVVEPTAWWTWQLLGLIVATNLGAVILAIMSARTANDLGKAYQTAFTPDFYQTLAAITHLKTLVEREAASEGRNLGEEIEIMAPKVWSVVQGHLVTPVETEPMAPLTKDAGEDLFGEGETSYSRAAE